MANAGRPRGSKSPKSRQWGRLSNFMLGKGARRALDIMNEMDDAEYMDTFLKLLRYFRPQLQSTNIEASSDIVINVVAEEETIKKI